MWAATPAIGAALRAGFGHNLTSVGMASATVALGTAGLTAFTHHVFKPRGASIQLHASASVAAAGGWLLGALNYGVTTPPLPGVWLAGVVLPAAWTIRRIARNAGSDGAANVDGSGGVLETVGLAKARFRKATIEANGARVQVPLSLDPGVQTVKDAQDAAEKLAGRLGLRPGAVRVAGDPQHAATAHVTIVPTDPLDRNPALAGTGRARRVHHRIHPHGRLRRRRHRPTVVVRRPESRP